MLICEAWVTFSPRCIHGAIEGWRLLHGQGCSRCRSAQRHGQDRDLADRGAAQPGAGENAVAEGEPGEPAIYRAAAWITAWHARHRGGRIFRDEGQPALNPAKP